MKNKATLLVILLIVLNSACDLKAQVRTTFSGETDKFTSELQSFMGPNIKEDQLLLLNSFIGSWDSTLFSTEQKGNIIAISNNMVSKRMRPNPHFINYLGTIMSFLDYDYDTSFLSEWCSGLNSITSEPKSPVSLVNDFIVSSGLLLTDSILSGSRSATWKILSKKFSFKNDSVFKIIIPETDLLCYTTHDSTLIKETSGYYIPTRKTWYGKKGKVTWEKAGYPGNEVYVSLEDYKLDASSSSFTIDSVLLTNHTYFESPVMGVLSDRVISIPKPENASYPRFTTYQKSFTVDNIYENINFTGGLAFEGATVRGTGDRWTPASLDMYRNDTLYVNLKSGSFIFNSETIRSQSTVFTLFLDKDSIYHSDIACAYYVPTGELNTYRSRFPTSKSPYFSSYHQMDMYFEYLSWKLNESKITLSRARGASMSQAYFESASFFNENEFFRIMGLDDQHPLYRLSRFAEYWYSTTFPINEFAKWMKQSPEYATALCIDLANKGFLFFDRTNEEVTIKKKLYDYIDSYSKKQDYDVVSILSETQAPLDNAVLDMKNYKMKINGIPRIFLSDSQNVAIYPYNNSIILEKNRSFEFDGVVQAGMITIFGKDFRFNYDTFKIKLTGVDSIALSVYTDERDEFGGLLAKNVEDLIQMTNAELLIDHPLNKSGLQSLEQYPIFTALSESYIFYDRIPGLEGIYPQTDFYFKLDPFAFENTDELQEGDLDLTGEFTAGGILPKKRQTLSLQNDKSLGFLYEIEDGGVEIYGGKGIMHNEITMSNSGLKGHGQLNYLTATAISPEINMFPDSVITQAETFNIASNTLYPEVRAENTNIRWYPDKDEWYASPGSNEKFTMFNNGTELKGDLILTSKGLSGSGDLNFTDSRISTNKYSFSNMAVRADTASYNLNSVSGDGFAFIAEDANTFVDFEAQLSRFSLNTDKSLVKFPEINYICTMTDFEYDMTEKVLSMTQKGRESSTLMSAEDLLKQDLDNLEKPTFFSTNMVNDTLTFSATRGRYLLQEEKIIAEDVNYIKVADALIQPDKGILRINKGAKFDKLNESVIAINNRHIIHTAQVNIMRTTRYEASGIYDYTDENNTVQAIKFNEIIVDSLRSKGTGYIPQTQNFKLSPHFTFLGDVHLKSENEHLNFLGSAGIVHDCDYIGSAPMKFNSDIDPLNIMIPVTDKPRDINGNLITAGTYITVDSTHMYSAFLSPAKAWNDIALVATEGWLIYDKQSSKYKIAQKEKLANPQLSGSLVTFDKIKCDVYSEGPIELGLDYGLLDISCAGNVSHFTDSAKVILNAVMALDFHFSAPAMNVMSDEIRFMAGLESVDLSTEEYTRAMQDLLGNETADKLKEDMDLFGMARNMPSDFNPELILNDLQLVWNEEYRSYRSVGKIGIGFAGPQALNIKVDGYVELQKRRSGDMLDIYLKPDGSTWYWFSYTRGNLMALSANNNFNSILGEEKVKDRKHPDNSVRLPYTYMLGVRERLDGFLRRMERSNLEEEIVEDQY